MMKATEFIREVAYRGNIGIHELFLFHDHATPAEKKKLEQYFRQKNMKAAIELIEKVVGYKLDKREPKYQSGGTMKREDLRRVVKEEVENVLSEYGNGYD